jgi:hypothetical protein
MKKINYRDFCNETGFTDNLLENYLPFNFALKTFNGAKYDCGCGKIHILHEEFTRLYWHGKPLALVGNIEEVIASDNKSNCGYINYIKNTGSFFYKYTTLISAKIPKTLNDDFIGENKENLFDKFTKDEIKEKYKNISKFYNEYEFIESFKNFNKKLVVTVKIQKHFKKIIKLDKKLFELSSGLSHEPYRVLLVGAISYKFLKIETMKKVHKDLERILKLIKKNNIDLDLEVAIENILDDHLGELEN